MTDLDATSDLVARAQATLARAVARARAGEDRELTQQVRRGGEVAASVLSGLLKLSRVHSAENRAFEAPVEELSRAIAELVYVVGAVHLVVIDEQVYVNDIRLRADTLAAVKDLGPELARHGVGGVTFHAALDPGAVRRLVAAFAREPADVAARRALQLALVDAGVRTVELTPRLRFREQGEARDLARDPRETVRRAIRLVEETYTNVAYGRVLNPLPLRRTVADILQLGVGAPESWEALHETAGAHGAHAAAVMMVALAVGRTAGYATGLLHDLGVAALVHDVGYALVPPDQARGAEGLARHPGEGARAILRQRGFHVAKLRRLRAVLDHHRDQAEPRGAPSPLGAVLRIAEDWATLVRVYRGRVSPAEALGGMARAAGRLYDPVLMQITVNTLGRFPPWTVLELDDGRVVRSVAPVRSPGTFASPLVREVDRRTRAAVGECFEVAGTSVRRVLRA